MSASPGWQGQPELRGRLGAGLVVAALHLGLVVVLLRGLAVHIMPLPNPSALTVIAPPPPYFAIPPMSARHPGGGQSLTAPQPSQTQISSPITLADQSLILAGGDGVTSNAGVTGTGAGQSTGTGTGSGQGATKISGEIQASDYPAASRPLRIGDYVIVALTVGADGRPTACRIHRPSRDPQADAITCNLARSRFRFRPATDAGGNPVEAEFGWRQAWHY